MADNAKGYEFDVVLKRFAGDLSGKDLASIRTQVAGMSQEALSAEWGVSRNAISRMENHPDPDFGVCDRYMGLMVRKLMLRSSQRVLGDRGNDVGLLSS